MLDGSYMFRSTTIIRELAIDPGQNYVDIKTFSKLYRNLLCGDVAACASMARVLCAVHRTAHNTHAILGYADTPTHNKLRCNLTEYFNEHNFSQNQLQAP